MNFSRPFANEYTVSSYAAFETPQVFGMASRPALRRSSRVSVIRQSITDRMVELSLDDCPQLSPDTWATLGKPFDQPAWDQVQSANQSEVEDSSNTPKPLYRNNSSTPQECEEPAARCDSEYDSPSFGNVTTFVHDTSHCGKAKKKRYYSYALSEEDKQALITKEKDVGSKSWAPKDLVRFQEARVELVPLCEDRYEIIAGIAEDKRRAEAAMFKAERKVFHLSNLPFINKMDAEKHRETTNQIQSRQLVSQSMIDLRASSAPLPLPSPLSPVFEGQTLLTTPFDEHTSARARPASGCDYFARRHSRQSSVQSQRSSLSSSSPNRVRSSLSSEARSFEPSPDVTFDSFLAPHASGKGEAYRGANNAKKPQEMNGPRTASESIISQDSRRERIGRRLSQMPSMPTVRKQKSKGCNSPLNE